VMDAAKHILERLGYESVEAMAVNESYTIEVDGYEDLTIEKVGPNRLSVAHHYVQRGDLMCDTEIVFHIDNGVWTPVRFTQHPHVHQHDEDGLKLVGFVEQWSVNLRRQGYIDSVK